MTSPKLEAHDFSKMFPPISEEDFGKLVADIKANGLHQRIVRYQGKILDGNNRYRAWVWSPLFLLAFRKFNRIF
jgi:ParB-like chromosome segregation protein Spo0J